MNRTVHFGPVIPTLVKNKKFTSSLPSCSIPKGNNNNNSITQNPCIMLTTTTTTTSPMGIQTTTTTTTTCEVGSNVGGGVTSQENPLPLNPLLLKNRVSTLNVMERSKKDFNKKEAARRRTSSTQKKSNKSPKIVAVSPNTRVTDNDEESARPKKKQRIMSTSTNNNVGEVVDKSKEEFEDRRSMWMNVLSQLIGLQNFAQSGKCINEEGNMSEEDMKIMKYEMMLKINTMMDQLKTNDTFLTLKYK